MRGGAREMVLDAVGGFSFRNCDVVSINLQVLQWPAHMEKGREVVTMSFCSLGFLECFDCVNLHYQEVQKQHLLGH